MSYWIDYHLDVLASSPTEINHIAERLKQPAAELVNWYAKKWGKPPSEVATDLTNVVRFKDVGRALYVVDTLNKTRCFMNQFGNMERGIVHSHMYEISEEFPSAIFFLQDYVFMDGGDIYTSVIRAGEVIRHTYDSTEPWAKMDIFAPYRYEYEHGLEFGSFWDEWLEDEIAGERGLSISRDPEADEEADEFEWQWWQQPE